MVIIVFSICVFLFFYLLVVIGDETIVENDTIRHVKQEKGIILNPLRLGFICFDHQYKINKNLPLMRFINSSVRSFILQFFLKKESNKTKRERNRYLKLREKYYKGEGDES